MTHGGFGHLLKNGGFQAFLWTQFLGAFNDSFYQSVVLLHAQAANPAYVPLSLAVFNLPSLLFSGYAGHLADAVSKRRVMIGVKVFEVGIAAVGVAALAAGSLPAMMVVMFLLGLHAAVFGPAKYGIVPEIWPDEELSRANALLEMSTFVAIVLGMSVGALLFGTWHSALWKSGLVTLGVAVTGCAASLRITRVAASGAPQAFRWNPFGEIVTSTKRLAASRPLWLTVLGIAYFWFLGAIFKMVLPAFGADVLHASETRVGLLWTFLAIGVGAGNMLAGRLSGSKVELGLVPLGSIWLSLACFALFAARHSYLLSMFALVAAGVSSGLFVVPLYAYMQQRAGAQEKGRVVAANNFYQTVAMLLASGALVVLGGRISPSGLLAGLGVLTVIATVVILTVVPDFFVRFTLWLFTHTLYRIKIVNGERVPLHGPALLVANHVSYADGLLVSACVQRFVRFLVWRPFYEHWALHHFLRLAKAIPAAGGPRGAVESIRAARRELAAGHVVCVFPEGTISRTGNLLPFKRGLEKIVEGLDVPVIPVHLDGVWGSIFSFSGGRAFRKFPRRIPYPVTVSFGEPMPPSSTAHEVRQAILELGAEAMAARKTSRDRLDARFIRNARRGWNHFAMADSSGRELTYGRALASALVISRWVKSRSAAGERIGLLLPASVGGALANIGMTLAGRVPVNLNFTAGREAMHDAIGQCEMRTILTSRAFLAKAKLEELPGMVFLEDVLSRTSSVTKLLALAQAGLLPVRWLAAQGSPDDTATIIFSSGSTGVPKGVMLSHYNVIANIDAIRQVFSVGEADKVVGVLPLFHSFGYTVTVWFPLVAGCGAVYHPNPTDARGIGELVGRYRATLLVSTPTFCAGYTRKCSREEFASLRYVLAGGEALRESVAGPFREKFALPLLEGYGATEMAPVIAVNTPDCAVSADGAEMQIGHKLGTVGHPLPGVAARVVHLESGERLGVGVEGMLLVKGANCMLGYLGQPARTAEVLRGGWYVTGDIAAIDADGFMRVTGRLSRYSKIAGEMVPHLKVEEALSVVLCDGPCAVTGIPDGARGERLVAMYTKPEIEPAEVWERLAATELPRLWLPKRENVYLVEALPLLGTGKLDLRGLRDRAVELASLPQARA